MNVTFDNFVEEAVAKAKIYLSEANRRQTFKTWIYDNNVPCNADKLAEAGFIFISNENNPDLVKCFFCKKELDGWEKEDDPWKEHLEHSNSCLFGKLQKSQNEIPINELLQIILEYNKSVINEVFDNLQDQVVSTVSVDKKRRRRKY